MQYLPFILWSILTIMLTILAIIILPVLLVYEKFNRYVRRDKEANLKLDQEVKNTYSLPVRD